MQKITLRWIHQRLEIEVRELSGSFVVGEETVTLAASATQLKDGGTGGRALCAGPGPSGL